jgi:hypothetical protein
MIPGKAIAGTEVKKDGMYADMPGVVTIYMSQDEHRSPPGTVRKAVESCRALNADVIAIETDGLTIVATYNTYDNTYAAAVCKPDVSLSAVARSLQLRLFDMPASRVSPELLSAASVQKITGIWERKIALLFGERYAAGIIAATMSGKTPDSMTTDDLKEICRSLTSVLGDCIDLRAIY